MKQYRRYRMDFSGEWLRRSAMCMGFSVFVQAVYYLGICNLQDLGFGTLLIGLWLPMLLGVGYVVLLRGLKWNAPGVYGLLCAAFCVVYILGALLTGNVLRIILAIIGYLLCAAVYLIVVGGYFPSWLPAVLVFVAAMVLRVILFDLGRLSVSDWIAEAGTLSSMAAFALLPLGLKKVEIKELS